MDLIGPRYIRQPRDLRQRGLYYNVHYMMLVRCFDASHKDYEDYGGRGITVCRRWVDPEFGLPNFIDDLCPRPCKSYTLDRIDPNGDYTPENTRWATYEQQNNNQRHLRKYHYEGEFLTLTQIARYLGIHPATLRCRVNKYGWSFERAISTPVRVLGGNP